MHLNVASVAGFILCLGIIITGIATNGGIGTIMNFIHVPSMLVTFGGALFAVMITSDSFADYLDGLKSFPEAFHKVKLNSEGDYLENIVAIAAGDSSSYALTKTGEVYSRGYNGYGRD